MLQLQSTRKPIHDWKKVRRLFSLIPFALGDQFSRRRGEYRDDFALVSPYIPLCP